MSKRELDAIEKILTDPENSQRTGSEVAELVIQALDDVRSRTHRLAVVGQIHYEPQGPVHTVILGPFSARGILDTQEKFLKATEGGCTARGAGEQLAWDTKTGKGRGRFMLAPAFVKPRDAWDFFRGSGPAEEVAEVATLIPREIGPVCLCGLKSIPRCRWCGRDMEPHCPRHEPGAAVHVCREGS